MTTRTVRTWVRASVRSGAADTIADADVVAVAVADADAADVSGAETMTAAVAEIAASLNRFFMDMSFAIIEFFRSWTCRRRPVSYRLMVFCCCAV